MVTHRPGGDVVRLSVHPGVGGQGVEVGVGGLTAFQLSAGHLVIAGLGDNSENGKARTLVIFSEG